LAVFNGLEAWFTHKLVVLRNLEAKILKTWRLRGLICEISLDAMLPIYAKIKTPEDRIAL
jgi:hypothetical protein